MIKAGKWYLAVDAAQLDTMIEDYDLEIEALEKEKDVLQKSVDKLVSDFNSQRDVLIVAQNDMEEALDTIQRLTATIHDLEQEVLALQKAAFTPLPIEAPAKNKGGRPKKANVISPKSGLAKEIQQ